MSRWRGRDEEGLRRRARCAAAAASGDGSAALWLSVQARWADACRSCLPAGALEGSHRKHGVGAGEFGGQARHSAAQLQPRLLDLDSSCTGSAIRDSSCTHRGSWPPHAAPASAASATQPQCKRLHGPHRADLSPATQLSTIESKRRDTARPNPSSAGRSERWGDPPAHGGEPDACPTLLGARPEPSGPSGEPAAPQPLTPPAHALLEPARPSRQAAWARAAGGTALDRPQRLRGRRRRRPAAGPAAIHNPLSAHQPADLLTLPPSLTHTPNSAGRERRPGRAARQPARGRRASRRQPRPWPVPPESRHSQAGRQAGHPWQEGQRRQR